MHIDGKLQEKQAPGRRGVALHHVAVQPRGHYPHRCLPPREPLLVHRGGDACVVERGKLLKFRRLLVMWWFPRLRHLRVHKRVNVALVGEKPPDVFGHPLLDKIFHPFRERDRLWQERREHQRPSKPSDPAEQRHDAAEPAEPPQHGGHEGARLCHEARERPGPTVGGRVAPSVRVAALTFAPLVPFLPRPLLVVLLLAVHGTVLGGDLVEVTRRALLERGKKPLEVRSAGGVPRRELAKELDFPPGVFGEDVLHVVRLFRVVLGVELVQHHRHRLVQHCRVLGFGLCRGRVLRCGLLGLLFCRRRLCRRSLCRRSLCRRSLCRRSLRLALLRLLFLPHLLCPPLRCLGQGLLLGRLGRFGRFGNRRRLRRLDCGGLCCLGLGLLRLLLPLSFGCPRAFGGFDFFLLLLCRPLLLRLLCLRRR